MGYAKFQRPAIGTIGPSTVQLLTTASTGTLITPSGVTVIATTVASKVFKMSKPLRAGDTKTVAVYGTTADVKTTIQAGPTSTARWYGTGSTYGTVLFTTHAAKYSYKAMDLVAMSTLKWMLLSRSSGVIPQA